MASSSSGVNGPSSTTRAASIVPTNDRVRSTIATASSTVTRISLRGLRPFKILGLCLPLQRYEPTKHLQRPARRQELARLHGGKRVAEHVFAYELNRQRRR